MPSSRAPRVRSVLAVLLTKGDRAASLRSAARASAGPCLLGVASLLALSGGSALAQEPRDQHQIARQTHEEARREAATRSTTDEQKRRRSTRTDASRIPRMASPTVHVQPGPSREPVIGWAAALDEPAFSDRRRRLPAADVPPSYIHAVKVGERFVFDVYFGGNPAGLAEAGVVEYQADKRGEPPQGSGMYRLTGRAVTSGVVSLLTSMEDRMETWIDASNGAVMSSVNFLERSGLGAASAPYKVRITETDFEGRGQIRLTDARDGRTTKMTRQVPRDTFDPLSAMAWVRSLDLEDGEVATAHALDGRILMKIEVVGRGKAKLDPMPSVAHGLGVRDDDVYLLEGTLSWVDRWGVVRAERRRYTFRAYVTHDDRRLLLAIETDMFLGVLRLILNRYDPPVQASP